MIIRCPDARSFRDRAGSFLLADEARHQLLLRILESNLRQPGVAGPAPWWMVVERAGAVVAAAVMTPPHPLVVSDLDASGCAGLLGFLRVAGAPLPMVNGPATSAERFAHGWCQETGGRHAAHRRLRLFSSTTALAPGGVSGRLRQAVDTDLPLVAEWLRGFDAEALQESRTPDAALEKGRRFIRQGGVAIWEDGEPRAMANATVPTGSGVCINGVWTPPAFRRRGYATACVAALTRRQLESGRSYVCLFTDLANPVSNSIYPKIGYTPIVDFTEYRLDPPR